MGQSTAKSLSTWNKNKDEMDGAGSERVIQ